MYDVNVTNLSSDPNPSLDPSPAKGRRYDLNGYTVFIAADEGTVFVMNRDSGQSSYGICRGDLYEWESSPSICNRLLSEIFGEEVPA